MNRSHSITAIALTGIMGLGVIGAPMAANASEQGKRNTTYALGAVAAALLLTQHNKLPGLLAAGGAAYAYSQYNKDIQSRHRRNDYGYNDNRRYNGNSDYNSYNRNGSDDYNRNGQSDNYRNDPSDNYRNDPSDYGNLGSSGNSQSNGYRYGENGRQNYSRGGGTNSWDSRGSGRRVATARSHSGR